MALKRWSWEEICGMVVEWSFERGRRARQRWSKDTLLLEDRQTPAALGALLANVLLAYATPENVVVCEGTPTA